MKSRSLENHGLLQNTIQGLSLVNFCFIKADDLSTFRRKEGPVRKHVNILDRLALPITFKAKNGDVAATGMIEEANKVTIL